MQVKYSDLEAPMQACVAQPSLFDDWARAIVERVKPALDEWGKVYGSGGRKLWDVVRVVSWRRGVLKEKLSRESFAELVCRVCPDLGSSSTLNASLKGSEVTTKQIDNYAQLNEKSWLKNYGTRVEALFDVADQAADEAARAAAVSAPKSGCDYLGEVLQETLCKGSMNILRHHKEYLLGDGTRRHVRPAWSIEIFLSEDAVRQNSYSTVIAFEWFDKRVTDDLLSKYYMEYCRFFQNRFTLIAVSPFGFYANTVKLAKENSIGLIRLDTSQDPQKAMDIVAKRSINDPETEKRRLKELYASKMREKMIIFDGEQTTTLADLLSEAGVRVDKRFEWTVPYKSKEDIEIIANQTLMLLEKKRPEVFDEKTGFLDVYKMARLTHEVIFQELPLDQYACLDVSHRRITLNTKISTLIDKSQTLDYVHRFSLAHEMGHYIIHNKFLNTIVASYGETKISLKADENNRNNKLWRMEWQANYFAVNLLMPREKIYHAFLNKLPPEQYERLASYIGIRDYELRPSDWDVVLGGVSKQMCVSKTAVRYRLIDLGWLIETDKTYEEENEDDNYDDF